VNTQIQRRWILSDEDASCDLDSAAREALLEALIEVEFVLTTKTTNAVRVSRLN